MSVRFMNKPLSHVRCHQKLVNTNFFILSLETDFPVSLQPFCVNWLDSI